MLIGTLVTACVDWVTILSKGAPIPPLSAEQQVALVPGDLGLPGLAGLHLVLVEPRLLAVHRVLRVLRVVFGECWGILDLLLVSLIIHNERLSSDD